MSARAGARRRRCRGGAARAGAAVSAGAGAGAAARAGTGARAVAGAADRDGDAAPAGRAARGLRGRARGGRRVRWRGGPRAGLRRSGRVRRRRARRGRRCPHGPGRPAALDAGPGGMAGVARSGRAGRRGRRPSEYIVADLEERLAQRGHRGQYHGQGEQGDPDGQRGPQHRLAPVGGPAGRPRVSRTRAAPRCRPPPSRCRAAAAPRAVLAARPGQAPDRVGEEAPAAQDGPGTLLGVPGRGEDRGCPDLVADPVQAVRAGLDMVRGGVQRPAHELGELIAGRALRASSASYHQSCSSAERRATMPRAVWLLTAPRLMPMVAAISASDRSA